MNYIVLCVFFFFPTDDSNGEQQDETFFVGQRSGRVVRPLGTGKFFVVVAVNDSNRNVIFFDTSHDLKII